MRIKSSSYTTREEVLLVNASECSDRGFGDEPRGYSAFGPGWGERIGRPNGGIKIRLIIQ
jgi:hypothetical protein